MHVSALLYTRRFDFPYRTVRPSLEIMIASLPRAGSTTFCIDLWRSGLLGAPMEYLNRELMLSQLRWRKLLRKELHYWRMLQRVRTGPNGVFSYKFFVQDYLHTLKTMPKLIKCVAPARVIYLTRQDKLSQAISYSKAIRSGNWFADQPGRKSCEYDDPHIKTCVGAVARQEDAWEQVFRMTHEDPLRMTYEEFLADKASAMARIMRYVFGAPQDSKELPIPQIGIQRDQESIEWRRRFAEANATY